MALNVNPIKPHVAIKVRDIQASVDFYRKLFGIEPSKIRTGYAKFDVQQPPLNFSLNQIPFSDAGALSHFGIQVSSSSDVLAVGQQWKSLGLITRDEMQTTCCYAVQDKAWVQDPDGNEWEVFVVLEDNLPEKAASSASCCAPSKSAADARCTAAAEPCSSEQNA